MKNFVVLTGFSLFLLILQTTIIPDIIGGIFGLLTFTTLASIKINFLLIIVVFCGLHRKLLEGVVIASILGYFMDLFSPGHLGLYSLLFVILFLMIKNISSKIYFKAEFMNVFWTFTATITSNFFILIMYATTENFENFYASFLKMLLPEALLNAFAAPFVFKILKLLDLLTDKTMEDETTLNY